jgi:hypothetical protein
MSDGRRNTALSPSPGRLLTPAIRRHGVPATRTRDGREAHEAAITSGNAEHGTSLIIRQVQSWQNMGAQDPRGVQRVPRPR